LTGKNQRNNIERYVRIAFESLDNYKDKDNRKQYAWNNAEIDNHINVVLQYLSQGDTETALNQLKAIFEKLADIAVAKW